MNAIIPLNITALRVNGNDESKVVGSFSGRRILFEKIPCKYVPTTTNFEGVSIDRPLDNSPASQLGQGIHLHWELPDYFRRGHQSKDGGPIKFPAAPNRWLVIRYLRFYDQDKQQYDPVETKAWVVESDFIGGDDTYGVPVPLYDKKTEKNKPPGLAQKPWRRMGRFVELENWNPATEKTSDFLPSYTDQNGDPYHLTALGFVGPHFSSYYPECSTVFGFSDDFDKVSRPGDPFKRSLKTFISNNTVPLKFKASYQVIGWIDDETKEPFVSEDISTIVKKEFEKLQNEYKKENVAFNQTPADLFVEQVSQQMGWKFNTESLPNPEKIDQFNIPERTICHGMIQEIVWDFSDESTSFLEESVKGDVKVGIGNTTTQALAALIKKDLAPQKASDELLTNMEYLLDALQSGWLNRLEKNNGLFQLEEILHSRSFTSVSGGHIWVIKEKDESKQGTARPEDLKQADEEITLPEGLANDLHLLNQAQKAYDTQRGNLEILARQVFLDWVHYLDEQGTGQDLLKKEISDIKKAAEQSGFLPFSSDSDGSTHISKPKDATSQAYKIWQQHQQLTKSLKKENPDLIIHRVPAANFHLPTEPVLVLQGDKIEPVARNGNFKSLPCRLSNELITQIKVNGSQTLESDGLSGLSLGKLPDAISQDVKQLIQEVYLLTPMLADSLKTKIQGSDAETVISDLQKAQGGESPADGQKSTKGFFEKVRSKDYVPQPDFIVTVGANTFKFTHPAGKGWAPSPISWSAQRVYSEFSKNRFDPFLPLFLVWEVEFDPLIWQKSASEFEYGAGNLKDFFKLDPDSIDYRELVKTAFTRQTVNAKSPALTFSGSITLSRKITQSLIHQVEGYMDSYPDNPANAALKTIPDKLKSQRILAQGLSGLNTQLLQMEKTRKVKARNLREAPVFDQVTQQLGQAASADSWYDLNFNNCGPEKAPSLFSPLRAGYLTITSLTIVDVFGQRMELFSPQNQDYVPSETAIATSLTLAGDNPDKGGKVFLPPRLDIPTRLWFRWLSANHPNKAGASDSDYVEMNSHPATSPVFGWVMPNHLDNSLFFYQTNGTPIGSFGLEHGVQKYRTRPENMLNNPSSELSKDIGPKGQPVINGHLAQFMWFVDSQKNHDGFLADLMQTIEKSHQYINPAQVKEDTDLAFLIGRPLVLTRSIMGLETKGGAIPVRQGLNDFNNVAKNNDDYKNRETQYGGNVQAIQFPLRLGDLSKANDGLVGYLIDTPKGYQNETFYSPAAASDYTGSVQHPAADTIQLTLNSPKTVVTLLMDPRAAIHATTGILPVEQLQIPADQFTPAISKLAMTFFTHPVLGQPATGAGNPKLSIPVPQEKGYGWSWLSLKDRKMDVQQLSPDSVTDQAFLSYTPQYLEEGWLNLHKKGSEHYSEPYNTRLMLLFPQKLGVQYGDWPTNAQLAAKWSGLKLRDKDRVSTAAAVFAYYRNTTYWGFPTWQLGQPDAKDPQKDIMGTMRIPKDQVPGIVTDIADQDLINSYRSAYGLPATSPVNLDDFNTWSKAVFVYYQYNKHTDGTLYLGLPTFSKNDQKKTREAVLFPRSKDLSLQTCYDPLLKAAYRKAYKQAPDVKVDLSDPYIAGTALAVWAQQFTKSYFGGIPTWQSGNRVTPIKLAAQDAAFLRAKKGLGTTLDALRLEIS